jgi:pimeloyl-ACP methyl ester carboxylesterase
MNDAPLMSDSPIRQAFINANGLTFEVHMCGEGEKLALCLHGFPEHAIAWRFQLPLLASLGYTVWAPNLRGYGRSSRPKGVQAYSADNLLLDIKALAEVSGKRLSLLVGHDWGGLLAWTLAMRKLMPLDRLVIMNCPHPRRMAWALWHLPGQRRKSWYFLYFQIPRLPEWALGRGDAWRIRALFTTTCRSRKHFTEDILSVFRTNAAQPGALTAMINYYRAGLRFPPREWGKSLFVDIPTLMIWGEEDSAISKGAALGTEAHVRDLTLRFLPGVSHWVQQEAPEAVNAILAAWLTGKPVPQIPHTPV